MPPPGRSIVDRWWQVWWRPQLFYPTYNFFTLIFLEKHFCFHPLYLFIGVNDRNQGQAAEHTPLGPLSIVRRENVKANSRVKRKKLRFALLSPPGRLWSPSFVMFPENTCQGTPKPAKPALMGPSSIVRRGARFRKVRCTQFREMINQI